LLSNLLIRPDEVYHVTVMPCYDKKLEAAREDFEFQVESQVETLENGGRLCVNVGGGFRIDTGEILFGLSLLYCILLNNSYPYIY
jgi:hypothetical protein